MHSMAYSSPSVDTSVIDAQPPDAPSGSIVPFLELGLTPYLLHQSSFPPF